MKRRLPAAASLACALAVAAPTVHADPPLITNEADVLDARRCQWDLGLHRAAIAHTKARGWQTQLACGVGGPAPTQLHAAFGRTRSEEVRAEALALGGKTAITGRADGSDTLAASLSYEWIGAREAGGSFSAESAALGLLFTRSFGAPLTGHANLGWLKPRESDGAITWNVAGEWSLTGRLEGVDIVAETFGEEHSRPWVAAGLRWALSDRASIHALRAVQRDTPRETLTTIGLRLEL